MNDHSTIRQKNIKKSPERNFVNSKSNYTNTLNKLYCYDEEKVMRLNFYNHQVFAKKGINLHSYPSDLFSGANSSPKTAEKKSSVVFPPKYEKDSIQGEALQSEIHLPEIKPPDFNFSRGPNILTKHATLKKMEDILNENSMEKEKKDLQEKLNELKNNMRRSTTTLLNIQKEIQKMLVEVDFLENFPKYTDKSNMRLDIHRKKNNTSEDIDKIELALTQAAKGKDRRDNELPVIKEKLESYEKNKLEVREKMKSIKESINQLKTRQEEVINKLLIHQWRAVTFFGGAISEI